MIGPRKPRRGLDRREVPMEIRLYRAPRLLGAALMLLALSALLSL